MSASATPLPPVLGPESKDPFNFRRNGKPRSGFGKWLKRNGPTIGRTTVQVVRGIADGIPGVSQVVNTAFPAKPRTPGEAGTRILVGWSTVLLVAMAMVMKLYGHIDTWTMVKLIFAFVGA